MMKKFLALLLTALMLLAALPLASPPALACTDFNIACNLSNAYTGERVKWQVDNVQGTGPFTYRFDLYKNGQFIYSTGYIYNNYYMFLFDSPADYRVKVFVKGNNYTTVKPSTVIAVDWNPTKITKVEPISAKALKITWKKVPGATCYLWRSTDRINWTLVKETTGTSLINTYLQPGKRYYYSLGYRRTDNWGVEFFWEPAIPQTATGVPMGKTSITSITSPSKGRIRMTWAKAEGASGYQVAMAASANGSYKSVRIVTGGTTAIFSGVKSGSILFFKIRPYRRIYTTTYWGQYSAYRTVKVK